MTALIIGENGSGKSAYAERLASSAATGPLIYIATMIPHGEDGEKRVARHIEQRRGYNFSTIEAPYSVSELDIPADATVLLEDVSNLLANVIFNGRGEACGVLSDIFALADKCENLILVTIGGLSEDDGGDEGTRAYIRALSDINGTLSDWADNVIMMEGGAPYEAARASGD